MLRVSSCPACRGNALKAVFIRTLRIAEPNGDDRQAFANFMLAHVIQSNEVTSQLMLCRTCYLVFYDQRLTRDELSRLYNDAYTKNIRDYLPTWGASYDSDPTATERNQQRRAEEIAERIGRAIRDWAPSRILDFGGTSGINMRALPAKAERYVFDLSAPKTEEGVTLLDNTKARAPYDLVMATHVLEHVTDVRAQWDDLIGLLSPGGHLYVEVPLEFHYQLRRGRGAGENEHFQFFTQTSLRHLARASGMSVRFLRAETHSWPSGTMWSICGLFQKPVNPKAPSQVRASSFAFAVELAQVAAQRAFARASTMFGRRANPS